MSSVWDVLEGKALQVVPGVTLDAHQHSISPGISRWEPASWVGASVNHDGGHAGWRTPLDRPLSGPGPAHRRPQRLQPDSLTNFSAPVFYAQF